MPLERQTSKSTPAQTTATNAHDAVGKRTRVEELPVIPPQGSGPIQHPPVQQGLTLGAAGSGPQRVVELDGVEEVVRQVIAANHAALVSAATAVNADRPEAAIRDAILVLYRNDCQFDTIDALITATVERLALIQRVAAVDWTDDVKDVTLAHPERPVFEAALRGLAPQEKIAELWSLTIQGVNYQKDLNKARRKFEPNPHYIKLGNEMESLLATTLGDKPALWAGGYDVSMYAQARGYRTLEVTTAGKIFDQLKLFRDFSTLGPLWNTISRKFVSSFTGEAHVFVRTMDKGSVLFRQELAEAVHLEGLKTLKWHVMKGADLSTLTEIDGAGRPSPGFTFDGFRAAAVAMTPDAFRGADGKLGPITGEPATGPLLRDKMVDEQQHVSVYITDLAQHVDETARLHKVDGPPHRPALDRLKLRAEIRIKNDPTIGVDLADLHAELRDDLAKAIVHLARQARSSATQPGDAGVA